MTMSLAELERLSPSHSSTRARPKDLYPFIGLSIGRRTPTAFCAATAASREDGVHFSVRRLERLERNTRYPQIAERLDKLIAGVTAQTGRHPDVFVDATMVGEPVIDLLLNKTRCWDLRPVYFNFGNRRVKDEKEIRLGKGWLVSRLQLLLQLGQLHLPKTDEARIMGDEIVEFKNPTAENADDREGSFQVGTQDEYVTALGLAVQDDESCPPWRNPGPRAPYPRLGGENEIQRVLRIMGGGRGFGLGRRDRLITR